MSEAWLVVVALTKRPYPIALRTSVHSQLETPGKEAISFSIASVLPLLSSATKVMMSFLRPNATGSWLVRMSPSPANAVIFSLASVVRCSKSVSGLSGMMVKVTMTSAMGVFLFFVAPAKNLFFVVCSFFLEGCFLVGAFKAALGAGVANDCFSLVAASYDFVLAALGA